MDLFRYRLRVLPPLSHTHIDDRTIFIPALQCALDSEVISSGSFYSTLFLFLIILITLMGCASAPGSPAPTEILGATTANNFVYVLGIGFNNCMISYAKINLDGSLGLWQNPSCNNISNILGNAGVIYDGITGFYTNFNQSYLYVLNIGSINYNTPIYTLLNQDGSVGQFSTTTSFSTGFRLTDNTYFTQGTLRIGFTSLMANGYAYIIGGMYVFSFDEPPFLYAPINSDGSIGTWISTSSMDCPLCYNAFPVVYNNRIYIFQNAQSYVYTDINPDGSLAGWNFSTIANTLSGFTATGSIVLYNKYIYSIGSNTFSFSSRHDCSNSNKIMYIPIYSDGSLGTWQSTTAMNVPRCDPEVVAYNGYIYAIDGAQTGNNDSVEYAPINPDGSLGKWQFTTSLQ